MQVNVSRSGFFACFLFYFPRSFTEQMVVPIVEIRIVRMRGIKLLRRYSFTTSEVPNLTPKETARAY